MSETNNFDETDLLVPFAANGTATDAQRADVEARAASNASYAQDLAAARKMRDLMQAREALPSPGEFGLARLRRDIAANRAAAPATTAQVKSLPRWRAATFAAMAASIVLAAALVLRAPGGGEPGYELAGSGTAMDAVHFQVAFDPTVSESEMRALLTELDLSIVSGPSGLGLYELRANDPDANERALLARLRASPNVIESVSHD